jgi:L-2,4-diaminobutyrate decarboxylase
MNKKPEKWKELLEKKILHCFPMPWAGHGSDLKFEHYIKSALKHLDRLKSPKHKNSVYLGDSDIWICDEECLQEHKAGTTVPQEGEDLHTVTKNLVRFFHGMVDWGHPKMGMNVVPPSTLPSIAANLMAAVFSPNLIEQEYSVNVSTAEVETTAMCAEMAGYDPIEAGGIFTFGGLGTWLYAMKIGLTKALGQESRYSGVRRDAQILCSEVSHFSKLNCSDWLGIGMDNVRQVGINPDNSINLDLLREAMEDILNKDLPIGLIVCTTGTTDAFGVDDIEGVVKLRDDLVKKHKLDYIPHIHADSVIGWAWTAFRHYDFSANPLEFSEGLKKDIRDVAEKFQHIHLADSMGIDFHKTGYTPYISSLFLLKDSKDFDLIRRPAEAEAYLFHFGSYNPGEYSLESSRSAAGALAAWANLKLFGMDGYQSILARLIEAERRMRKKIQASKDMVVINPDDHGFVTLYRAYPPGTDAEAMYKLELEGNGDEQLKKHNTYIHKISTEINRLQREENGPFLSHTSNHRLNATGLPIAALKVFPMSPYVDEAAIDMIMDGISKAKHNVDGIG